ncbi:MAG: PRK06851 family protein [Clostridia bacterium]|nr:PRK06851 family protein [Clostridia bacterium]MDD4049080.1 PRK06851 family protein [Clostridia bacterium]
MTKGKIKKVFPGNNTCYGFYSFYDNIIQGKANKIFILKGGPGVGKSRLMKKTGMVLVEKGFDVEYHCCSSDNDSLDGVAIPTLGVAVVDGTAPHVVDPKIPGAVDEIINLGEYWDEKILVEAKDEIEDYINNISSKYKMVYSYLKEAKVASDELEGYFKEATDWAKVNKLIYEIINTLFRSSSPQFNRKPEVRNLFASANTPGGYVNHLDTILQKVKKLYLLKGQQGACKEKILRSIYHFGTDRGLNCELYHCPFDPNKIELVCFPDIEVAFLRINEPLEFEATSVVGLEIYQEFNCDEFVYTDIIKKYKREIKDCKKRISHLRELAWSRLKSAKESHDDLEKKYIKAMDFAAVNKRGEEILAKILVIADMLPVE